jgi:cytochrome c2
LDQIKLSDIIFLFAIVGLLIISCQNDKFTYSLDPEIIDSGEKDFNTYCSSCHNLDNINIGPSLGGITKKIENNWL